MEDMSQIGFSATENWTVEEFYNFFHQINILYNRLYVLEQIKVKHFERIAKNKNSRLRSLEHAFNASLSAVDEKDRLTIKSIELHSPGDFNFLGVDKVILQLRELWKDISYRNKQDKQKEAEALRHDKVMNQLREHAGRQKILSNQASLMKKMGYDKEQIAIGIKALGDPLEQLADISEHKKLCEKSPNKARKPMQ